MINLTQSKILHSYAIDSRTRDYAPPIVSRRRRMTRETWLGVLFLVLAIAAAWMVP